MRAPKLTDEERLKRRAKRHEKHSAFLSRMVDEFKKVGFIGTFVFCVIVIVWCMALFTVSLISPEASIIPSVATALQIIAVTAFGILGSAFAFYCKAASGDKDSLNSNGLTKNKDGTISKIISTVASAAATFVTPKPSDTSGEDAAG